MLPTLSMMTTLPARDTKATITTLALTPGDALKTTFKESKPSLAYSLVEDDTNVKSTACEVVLRESKDWGLKRELVVKLVPRVTNKNIPQMNGDTKFHNPVSPKESGQTSFSAIHNVPGN